MVEMFALLFTLFFHVGLGDCLSSNDTKSEITLKSNARPIFIVTDSATAKNIQPSICAKK